MSPTDCKIDIQKIQKITDRRFVNLFKAVYIDKQGREKIWDFASRQPSPKCETGAFEKADAVVIVPYHVEREKLVVIREFRIPLCGYQYGFPAGLVDPGESAEDCARRELKEETGLRVTKVLRTSPPIYSSSGLTDESVVMVYVECQGEPSSLGNGSAEDIETVFVPAHEARRICDRPDLKVDVKTWLVMDVFAETGRI